MPNRNSSKNTVQTEVLEGELLAPEVKKPTVKKAVTNTRVERFIEEVEPDAVEAEEFVEAEFETEDEAEEDAPKSDLELLLEQARENSDYFMRVDRLTDYDLDGRGDMAANRQFCMSFRPPPLDYLDKIERKYGGGAYLITLYKRGKGGGIIKYWDEHIAHAALPVIDAPAPMQSLPAPAPSKLEDTFQRLMLKRMETALEYMDNPPAPATPAPQLPAAPSVESQLLELAKGDDGLKHKIIDKYFGGDEEKSSFIGDILKHPQEALQLVGAVGVMLNGLIRPQNGHAPQPQQLDPLTSTLLVVVQDLKRNKRVGHAADVIEDLLAQKPELRESFGRLLAAPAPDILSQLSATVGENLSEYTHAEAWVDDLKAELQPEGEQVEEEVERVEAEEEAVV